MLKVRLLSAILLLLPLQPASGALATVSAGNTTSARSIRSSLAAGRLRKQPRLAAIDVAAHLQESVEAVLSGRIAPLPFADQVEDAGSPWTTADTLRVVGVCIALVGFDVAMPYLLDDSIKSHLAVLGFMLVCSVLFNIAVWYARGEQDGIAWTTGYIVELALSMDNLFVFHLLFRAFAVPGSQANFALTMGIYGAVIMRIGFILLLSAVFSLSRWVLVVAGAAIIISGLMSLNNDESENVKELYTVRFFKWLLGSRLQDSYSETGRLFEQSATGQWQGTVLLLVVCIVTVIDVFFAMDSVGSKTGQIRDVYLNLTSSLLAMFSLRGLFFIIRDMAEYFELVKYGICAILCFIGVSMILEGFRILLMHLHTTCAVIFTTFALSVALSILKARLYPEGPSDEVAGKENCKDSCASH